MKSKLKTKHNFKSVREKRGKRRGFELRVEEEGEWRSVKSLMMAREKRFSLEKSVGTVDAKKEKKYKNEG